MVILGINEDHNAAAAIFKDGKIAACVSEERYSRIKNDTEYPYCSIESAITLAGINPNEIDAVVIAGVESDPLQMRMKRITSYSIADYVREMNEYWYKVLIKHETSDFMKIIAKEKIGKPVGKNYYDYSFMDSIPESGWPDHFKKARIKTIVGQLGIEESKIHFIDHHTAHAAYGYFAMPHDASKRAVVVTADGWGDGCNATISIAENNTLTEIHRTTMCNVARIYRWSTLLLGMKPNEHEYKVMGLAPYAKSYVASPAYSIYKETLIVDGIDFKWKIKPTDMYFWFKERFEGVRFDGIAGGLQQWLEELLIEWFNNILKHTNTDEIYFSGGLSMNVKANKALVEIPGLKKLYIAPSGGDESLAMGAAFAYAKQNNQVIQPLTNAYLGDEPALHEAKKEVDALKNSAEFEILENPTSSELARLLADGKVLGRCIGKMEFGARSLGNRAILCDPSTYDNIRVINEKIKFRDFWMPFTPSILDICEDVYLINPKGLFAPYMTLAFDTTELARKHLPAAIHPYDFTARPQIVTEQMNPEYYQLIKAFKEITGIGALLNTSLNLHGEPIVRTIADAIDTLKRSGLDGMILPGYAILKKHK